MNRLDAFKKLQTDSWYGKVYKKLSADEIVGCREFIREHAALDANNFELAVNRWFVDRPKPKNWTAMMELVSSSKPLQEKI